MRNPVPIIIFTTLIVLTGCNSKNKSDEIANYEYSDDSAQLVVDWQNEIGEWLDNGVECYGLVVAVNARDVRQRGKPVKAKVLRISKNGIKMRALESINIAPSKDCPSLGIEEGEIWLEKEGELFQTKEDAVAYLNSKSLFMPD